MRLAMVSLGDAPARPALITNDRVHDIGKHLPDAPKHMIGILESFDAALKPPVGGETGVASVSAEDDPYRDHKVPDDLMW